MLDGWPFQGDGDDLGTERNIECRNAVAATRELTSSYVEIPKATGNFASPQCGGQIGMASWTKP